MQPEELTLSILRKSESITSQPLLAKELGYSVGKINFILKALVDKGLIKIENFSNSKQKKNYKYLLTEEGIKEKIKLTEKFVARKKAEYDELHQELEEYRESEIVK
ncbi:MAG: MarR family EPS-associated transcriptional regulator [Campylobacterota bacterium]|nr:MarR family EPS-associated transcriptional regulator [Campylobacterota bacterium]